MLLAISVTLAGVACACAIPVTAPTGAMHHAHHDGDGTQNEAHCAHANCQGDCGIDAAVPDRDAGIKPPATPFDDGIVAVALPVAVAPSRILSSHGPPSRLWRTASTPVRRFDILLN